jgi:integrase
MKDSEVGQHVRRNPARLARPKAPKPYQNESVKALSDKEVGSLVSAMRGRAQGGDIVGKRDYALLLLYLATGLRRQEAIGLRGRDVHVGEMLVLEYRAKGGDYRSREVREPQVREALMDYLTASGRLHALKTDAPLWTRHDRAGKPGEPLTSHCFVKNLKRYAKEAGVRGSTSTGHAIPSRALCLSLRETSRLRRTRSTTRAARRPAFTSSGGPAVGEADAESAPAVWHATRWAGRAPRRDAATQ